MNFLLPPLLARRTSGWVLLPCFLLFSIYCIIIWLSGLALFRYPLASSETEMVFLQAVRPPVDGLEPTSHLLAPFVAWAQNLSDHALLSILRSVNLAGCLGLLFTMVRLLKRLCDPLPAVAGCMLWFCIPGLMQELLRDTEAVYGAWCFLLALSFLSPGIRSSHLLLGGVFGGVAVVVSGSWLPVLVFLAIGNHGLAPRRNIPFLGGLLGGGGLCFLLRLTSGGGTSPVTLTRSGSSELSAMAFLRDYSSSSFVLLAVVGLFLWKGWAKRGTWWWVLLGTVILGGSGVALASDTKVPVLIPLLLLSCICLPRLPDLLELHHPASYLSVIALQLLLFLPIHLGWSDNPWLGGIQSANELERRTKILDRLKLHQSAALSFVDGVSVAEDGLLIELHGEDLGSATLEAVAGQLENGQIPIVVLDRAQAIPSTIERVIESAFQAELVGEGWSLYRFTDETERPSR